RLSCFPCGSSSSGAVRDLHSVPTRRSSDLDYAGGVRREKPALVDAAVPHPDRGLLADRAAAVQQRGAHHHSGVGGGAGRHPVTPDRKSTRLNSSHVKISYAVFCLKKKKTEE